MHDELNRYRDRLPADVLERGVMFCIPGKHEFVNLVDDDYVPSAAHIARALSTINRYSGRCDPFYSVAAHCMSVADFLYYHACDTEAAQYAIIHDVAEMFTGDIPSPIKKMAPDVVAFEDYIVAKVSLALFGKIFDGAVIELVHKVDKVAGWIEMNMFMDACDPAFKPDGVDIDTNNVAYLADCIRKWLHEAGPYDYKAVANRYQETLSKLGAVDEHHGLMI